MSTLLVHIKGHRLLNKSLFRPQLYVFENRVVYKRQHIFTHDELTVTYNQISQVNLHKYIYRFAHIDIITTGQQLIQVKWAGKRKAVRAKKIIDEKVAQAHRKAYENESSTGSLQIHDFELSIKRLNELLNTGRISEREYKKRQKELLKKHY